MRRFWWLLIAAMLLCPAANAAEFRLRDDSVVVGRILRLTDGKDLVVDTAHMGEVTLEWEAVERIDGTHVLEVELFDGNRVFGNLTLENEVLKISGDGTVEFDPAQVYSISEVKTTFWDAFDAYTDMGINVVRGNSRVTQVSLGAGFEFDAPAFDIKVDAKTFVNEQTANQDTRRTTLAAVYSRNLVRGWSMIGLYQFEADEQQGLDSRSVLGGAVGRRVMNDRVQRLELFTGLALNSEDFVQAPDQDSSELLLGMRYRLRSTADIDTSMIVFTDTEQSDRHRVQLDASLSVDLVGELDLNLTAYDRYDSEPPPGIDSNDYGFVLGLRWSY